MTGYVKCLNKVIKVRVIEEGPNHKVLETENNEIVYISSDSKTQIWATEKECREKEKNPIEWCLM